jgi:hypothetical protein
MYGSAHVLVGLRFLVFICHKSILAWQTDEQTAGRQRGPQQSLRAMATVPPTAAAAAGPIAAAGSSVDNGGRPRPGQRARTTARRFDISGDDGRLNQSPARHPHPRLPRLPAPRLLSPHLSPTTTTVSAPTTMVRGRGGSERQTTTKPPLSTSQTMATN